ncbi:MAG: hypothetical protein K9H25_05525 [Rhodospirillum sp.]|nr:hypothetical protein [Rhodospirillum sp.]MCF8488949.1 hypothetical protein [Rhodospirillum sp.]MCF8499005.1 hypothetical protein [Rhodospirillum sp.]
MDPSVTNKAIVGPPSFDAAHADHLAGNLDRAEAGYRALLGKPEEVLGTRTLLAAIRRVRGDRGEAEDLERSELVPLSAGAVARLGRALLAMDDPVAARALARTLMDREPGESNHGIEGLVLLARATLALGDRDGAERILRVVVDRDPTQSEAICLLSRMLRGDGRSALALDLLTGALERCPGDARLSRERAQVLLARGTWTQGWRDMAEAGSGPPLEPWNALPVPGTRILLRAFGSLEETLLFLRFAVRLADGGLEVSLEAPEDVLPLLSLVRGLSRVGLRDHVGDDHDITLDLSALPGLMGVTPENQEPDGAYLEVPLDLVLAWGERLEPGLNLGLDWSRANREGGLGGGMPLEDLAPLLTLPGVNRIALAWWGEAARGAMDPWGDRITFPFANGGERSGGCTGTILDTAALLFSMDLVVTTDSAVAHLAGALGRPCWVLLPSDAGWYWGTEGEGTPWYSSLRLFRQQVADDWRGPVWSAAASVGQELVASRG